MMGGAGAGLTDRVIAVGLGEEEEESWRASPLLTALHDEPDGYAAG